MTAITPEGLEDLSVEFATRRVHCQVNSRRSHRGDFTVAEVASVLADFFKRHTERLKVDPAAEMAAILERPIDGLPETGWDSPISAVERLAGGLRPHLQKALGSDAMVVDLLAKAHIIIAPDTSLNAVERISDGTHLPPAACALHYLTLRDRLGEMADGNGARTAGDAERITISDINWNGPEDGMGRPGVPSFSS